ncbi:diguanylate cyclase [Kineosporia rhizophila]|uniref:GGDEF domain-containing response regulator n=1 Tax=Kineosporia TaxID=49184 RepID=UPI001E4BCFDE|nr:MULTISPECIES: diguanylate cyclase [Kineosporia]MCE0533910.1 diguanylate cyclase [Kineosporia rhizophila]GLY13449.1 diguanylate cyclase response regulator [Kineosporia sp. NBRC 101677]
MKILVVDDDPIALRILTTVVQAAGHTPLSATDGDAAWQLLSTEKIDVVISDWQMPGVDGLELCRRIREQAHYTYVVIVTSHSDPDEVMRGMQAGADDYLTKPIDTRGLRLRLIAAERVTAVHARLAEQQAELERLNTRLAAAARIDPLTALRNRRALDEDLPALVARCERYGHELSAVMLDVDFFKAYNDRLGHPAGDDALRRVAAVLITQGRQTDQFYRYGGEEFLCLLSQGRQTAILTAERLRRAVHDLGIPHPASAHKVVTFSAGVATWRPSAPDALLQEADEALYRAKAAGRNTVGLSDEQLA